ncbi:MAG TPA: glycosyltransferase family 39 protein [Candidatus Angelobacter sp.]|nr:glycosyltransferase family 39 protein [Candidatus Angelobacter sp.]
MKQPSQPPRPLAALQIYSIIFVAIFLLHAPLLRLPFFWDEAGYYVPAAYDLAHDHTLVPHTTLDTAHPPLPAAYLALWFSLSGWKPAVARVAMLLLAAFALTNVFLLARRIAGPGVALASTIATAVYPIFFVQSTLVHADLPAAAFSLWGIRLAVERRLWASQLAFCLAVLSKETAIIIPFALVLWEVVASRGEPARDRLARTAIWFTPLLPLAGWLIYHYHLTGRVFGGAEFYQYNVTQALNPLRFLAAFSLRLWHLFGTMNMMALTASALVAMSFAPVVDEAGERPRIAIPTQLQFATIMLVSLITFSLVGGALLTRYLLAVYPLVIIIGMSTLRRRIGRWEWPAAAIVICFVLALFFNPPYRFAPEDNLTYREFVKLHAGAARFLSQHEHDAVILTAWPAKDELTKSYLGYVARPLQVTTVGNFTVEEILKAQQRRGQYQVVYMFSTKTPSGWWFRPQFWQRLNRRFFDDHTDMSPEAAAELLSGKIVYLARGNAEWVAVLEIEQPSQRASLPQ